jgi:hypothetical protein
MWGAYCEILEKVRNEGEDEGDTSQTCVTPHAADCLFTPEVFIE